MFGQYAKKVFNARGVRCFSSKYPRWKSLIGNTPMVDLSSVNPNPQHVTLLGKCEFENPSHSIKDRIVQHILNEAERTGKLKPGGTVVAASSGNTAAAVAMQASVRGYKSIVITNSKCSKEKVDALTAFGSEVLLTRSGVPIDHPEHYQNVEIQLCKENDSYFSVNQYDNMLNPEAYFNTLGPEIWQQTNGEVDYFVAAGSTGGTITGTSRFLKTMNPRIQSVMPDPFGSIFYDYWKHGKNVEVGSFKVEGVGKDSIPKAMDFSLVDHMPRFTDEQAFTMCHNLAVNEGMMVGGSAGANVWAGVQIAKQMTEKTTIVVILCDSGIKYLSKIFNQNWMKSEVHDKEYQQARAYYVNYLTQDNDNI
jgi:cysteine synthase